MRVIIRDEVFDGGTPEPRLFELLSFAASGRHRVLVKRGACFRKWLISLSTKARDEYERALSDSEQSESFELSDHQIEVGPRTGCLAVDDAIERLGRPFLLYVEDEKSDQRFIEAVATPEHRGRVRRMHQRGWLTFRSHGGISKIGPMIEIDLGHFPGDASQMFAIFDSDAPAPGEPSRDATMVAETCQRRGVRYWMLNRRASENYLTRSALEAWAADLNESGKHRDRIEALYGEWFGERPERRHHFHMKHGFRKMTPSHLIYAGVPRPLKGLLDQAFGGDVAMAFMPDRIREVDLRAEGAWGDLWNMVNALVRSTR